jgi:hypothetical protein
VDHPPTPLAEDTSAAAEAILVKHYRGLEVHEKVALMMDLTRLADDAALMGIRERHPEASEREQCLRLAALKYGRDLMVAAYGWDPDAEGW